MDNKGRVRFSLSTRLAFLVLVASLAGGCESQENSLGPGAGDSSIPDGGRTPDGPTASDSSPTSDGALPDAAQPGTAVVTTSNGVKVTVTLPKSDVMVLPFSRDKLKLEVVPSGTVPEPDPSLVQNRAKALFKFGPQATFNGFIPVQVDIPAGIMASGEKPAFAHYDDTNKEWIPQAASQKTQPGGSIRMVVWVDHFSYFGLFGTKVLVDRVKVSYSGNTNGNVTLQVSGQGLSGHSCSLKASGWGVGKTLLDNLASAGSGAWTCKFSNLASGRYTFKVRRNYTGPLLPHWEQDLVVSLPANSTHAVLAQKYAPVLFYHKSELFRPEAVDVSFFQGRNVNLYLPLLGWVPLGGPATGAAASNLLATIGHSKAYIEFDSSNTWGTPGSGPSTVYWEAQETSNWIFLTYWMFYPYDAKGGQVGSSGSHQRDRESLTVVLNRLKGNKPEAVMYYGHLPWQTLSMSKDKKGNSVSPKPSWKERVVIGWDQVEKDDKCQHPIAHVALGSHAPYPRQGTYTIMVNTKWTSEEAGGGAAICPEGGTKVASCTSYKMVSLGGSEVRSFGKALQHLSFSGSWVTFMAGTIKAGYPPFTSRSSGITQWNGNTFAHASRFPDVKLGTLCVPCKQGKCTAGTTRCSSSGKAVEACNSNGCGWSSTMSCACGCSAGKCIALKCTPGKKQCDATGKAIQECNSSGCGWNTTKTCFCGCKGGACVSQTCTPGQKQCDATGKAIQECNSTGCGWTTTKKCSCGCKGGACVSQACTPGQKKCDSSGKAVQQCNSNGCGWTTTKTCSCGCKSGACVSQACTPGQKKCSGSSVLQCNSAGCGWTNQGACTCGCSGGNCKPTVCSPNSKRCNGNVVEQCQSNGCGWQTLKTCSSCGCSSGQCKTRYYLDSDSDGDGKQYSSGQCLTAPSGSYKATTNTDCNDNDSTVYYGAKEVWDVQDNNCNGQTDESGLQTWYRYHYQWTSLDWEHRFASSSPSSGWTKESGWVKIYPTSICGSSYSSSKCSLTNKPVSGKPYLYPTVQVRPGVTLDALGECIVRWNGGSHATLYLLMRQGEYWDYKYPSNATTICKQFGWVLDGQSQALFSGSKPIFRLHSGFTPTGRGDLMWSATKSGHCDSTYTTPGYATNYPNGVGWYAPDGAYEGRR